MIFYALMALPVLIAVAFIVLFVVSEDSDGKFFSVFLGLVLTGLSSIPVLVSWSNHAEDLARISSQSHLIEVYQEHVDSITKRLEQFSYPEGTLVNADTPIAAMVKSLSDAEDRLSQAKAFRAASIRAVEARRVGPMSGVIWLAGDYK